MLDYCTMHENYSVLMNQGDIVLPLAIVIPRQKYFSAVHIHSWLITSQN